MLGGIITHADSRQIHLDFDAGPTVQDIERDFRVYIERDFRVYIERDFRVYADPAGHPLCLCRISHDDDGSEGVSRRPPGGAASPASPAR
ncbi:hypothetical protein ACFWY6_37880 [Streptomyces sp. NPDC059037]|uniref:hypothetical protein n=1 Tax=Streptomyces sp. NPDC059037 TaxID=3346710 RepID=UPI0036A3777E